MKARCGILLQVFSSGIAYDFARKVRIIIPILAIEIDRESIYDIANSLFVGRTNQGKAPNLISQATARDSILASYFFPISSNL